jgi:hypothetical protein
MEIKKQTPTIKVWDFNKEVELAQRKEIEGFLTELSLKSERYYQQAQDEGYDNLHYYERDVSIGLTKRIGLITIMIIIAMIACFVN